jgi:hypothetical protein
VTTTTTTTTTSSASALDVRPESVQMRCADHVLNALAALDDGRTDDAAMDDFMDAVDLAFDAEVNAEAAARARGRANRAARRAWSGASDRPTNARQRRSQS